MKKLIVVFLSLCAFAQAQSYTNVTATLMDSSAQVWANASWSTQFQKPAGNNGVFLNQGHIITANQNGVANASGVFNVTLDNNIIVSPSGSQWQFTICPNATVAACNTISLTIFGATQDISAQINAALTVPVVNTTQIIARAYNDTEVNASYGALYINSISNTLKQCIQIQCNGSGWANFGVSSNNPTFTGVLTTPCVKFNFDLTNDSTLCSQAGTGHINLLLPTTSGTLALASATGNVSNSGTPLAHQVPVWVDATHILGITPNTSGFVLTSNGTGSDPTFQSPSGAVAGKNVTFGLPMPPDTVTPSNTSKFPAGSNTWSTFNPAATGPSTNQYIPGTSIEVPCASWKVQIWQPVGTATLQFKMQIYKMNPGSLTVISSAQITFGGLASPSFSSPGSLQTSDTISFAIDTSHDYYIVFDTVVGLPSIGQSTMITQPGAWISTADNYGVANGVALNLSAGSTQANKSMIVSWVAQS